MLLLWKSGPLLASSQGQFIRTHVSDIDVGFLGLEHIFAQDSWKFYSSKITYCILILHHLLKGKQRWRRNLLPRSFLIIFVPHQTRATVRKLS